VIYSESGVFEKCLFYKKNPDLVLVDTDVIVKAPQRLLISGMGDALATYFEAQSSSQAYKMNPAGGLATEAAKAIARLCYDTLLQDGLEAVTAARVGAITPAFERIVEANTLLSGLGFESAGLCVAHSIHNGLTALPETHTQLHGEKVAFGTLVQLVLEGRPRETFEEVLHFCLDVGLPVCLKDLGITDTRREHLLKVAERSLAEGETAHNLSFNPTVDSVLDAILTTNALGEDAKCTSLGCECH
jgi:glycerol dehydrogenase